MKRFQRKGLGYSKDLATHKAAVALTLGVYNFVRRHKSLDGQTPAQAAGIEETRWSLERVVEMTEAYWQPKLEAQKAAKAAARRLAEDAVFERALAKFWRLIRHVPRQMYSPAELALRDNAAPDFCADTHQEPESLTIDSALSELEFLHALEACSALRSYAGKRTDGVSLVRTRLCLWQELGRPHPAILQRFLHHEKRWGNLDWNRLPRIDRLIGLVDWSCAAYEALKAERRAETE